MHRVALFLIVLIATTMFAAIDADRSRADISIPEVSIVTPANMTTIRRTPVTFQYALSGGAAPVSVKCSILVGSTVLNLIDPCPSAFQISNLADGAFWFLVEANDAEGNYAMNVVAFAVGEIPPTGMTGPFDDSGLPGGAPPVPPETETPNIPNEATVPAVCGGDSGVFCLPPRARGTLTLGRAGHSNQRLTVDPMTILKDLYNDARPCQATAQDAEQGWQSWNTWGKAFVCVFSGAAFFDKDLSAKSWCIVDIGSNLIPIARLKSVGKLAGRYNTYFDKVATANKELRKAGLSRSNAKLLDQVNASSTIAKLLAKKDWLGAVNKLLVSRKASFLLYNKLLKTNANRKAVKRLLAVQSAGRDVLGAIGIWDDLEACKKAFK